MRACSLFGLLAVLFSLPASVADQGDVARLQSPRPAGDERCYEYRSRLRETDVRFCLDRTRPELPIRPEDPVIYYMHGINQDHRHWKKVRYSETLHRICAVENCPSVTIISFQTSGRSYFTNRNREQTGKEAHENWLIQEFIPRMETNFGLCSKRECRTLAGHSMGGWGALKTALRFPEMFSMAAVNSPALVPYSVFDSYGLWTKYADRHPLTRAEAWFLVWDGRRAFDNRKNFSAHDPSHLIASWEKSRELLPRLYFDVGDRDHYGFQEGIERFKHALSARGVPYLDRFYPGGTHDVHKEPEQRENLIRVLLWPEQAFTESENPARHW